jgi:hypothetical protein
MSTPLRARTCIVLAAMLSVALACSRRRDTSMGDREPAPSASSRPVEALHSSASAPALPPSAWFTGSWAGSYQATAHRIVLPTDHGGIPDWKADDGKAFVGSGTLELACGADGTVSGSARGPLGEQDVRGESTGDSLQARLVPRSGAQTAFAGTLTASRSGSDVTGDLRAASTDGRIARTGSVTLTKRAER